MVVLVARYDRGGGCLPRQTDPLATIVGCRREMEASRVVHVTDCLGMLSNVKIEFRHDEM